MIHLNVRTAYSLLQSTIRLEQYVLQMTERGSRSVAIADDAFYGVPTFLSYCQRYEVKPLIGLRTVLRLDGLDVSVIVYSSNETELKEQYRIIQAGGIEGRTTMPLIVLPENWKASDPVHRRRLYHQLLSFVDEEKLWLGLPAPQTTEQVQVLKQLRLMREELAVQLIPAPETRYMRPEDVEGFRAISAIREGDVMSNEDVRQKGLHVRLPSEMNDWFTTEELSELDRFEALIRLDHLPRAEGAIPEIPDADQKLKRLVGERLKAMELVKEPYIERAKFELEVIAITGFSSYFLIVEDIVRFARESGIEVGPGRGSAAGSLVSFALHITEVDPVHYGLLFERFLNPERVSMPDIDLDFEDERREEVVSYVLSRYGHTHAAQIGTLATFGAKAAIRDVARALGMTLEEGQAASKQAKAGGLDELMSSQKQMKWFAGSQKRQQLLRIAKQLEGLPRQSSVHAAGVVLSRQPIEEVTPLQPELEEHVTQYNMKDLEEVGLLKIDLLGLRNLSRLRKMEDLIRESDALFSLKTIPLNDARTYRLLARGETDGIFQFESTGMKQALRQVKPTEFEDIVVTMSLYRPGPMQFIETYAKRKHGMPYQPVHPDVEDVMRPTYGVLVYQEQVMKLLRKLGGYSYAEADLVRRAIAKKDTGTIARERERFLQQAKAGDQDVLAQIFSWIEKFAGYGFNRSHAVAYSLISYRLAYVKAHFPRVFHVVTSEKTTELVRLLRKDQIPVYPPDVLHGHADATLEGPGVRLGLKAVQGLTKRDVDRLIELNGQLKDVRTLQEAMEWKNKDQLKLRRLLGAGALDRMYHGDRTHAFEAVERLREEAGTHFLPDELSSLGLKQKKVKEPNWSEEEREALGTWVVHSPLTALPDIGIEPSTIEEVMNGTNGYLVVYVDDVRTFMTKKQERMGVLMVDDGMTQDEVVVFPRTFAQFGRSLYAGNILLLEVHSNERDGRKQLIVERVRPLHGQALFIRLTLDRFPELEDWIQRAQGDVPVVCRFTDSKEVKQLASAFSINPNEEYVAEAKRRFGEENVVLKRIDTKMVGPETSTKS
ncbi:MAG: DNA polymerase III subunit alpha [Exiguobacterium sp.]|uniref:DNA polymerase III subunit alpha n=1 Tax=Exiguobacterium sp. TaxID=44751 RepID=UPI00257E1254|nr:DNA polymerase III subunit alpha [Exiguobacterium sp.]MBQ6458557.1 DNA polymerase III subunit alpha [Exiguobacterium sp.]